MTEALEIFQKTALIQMHRHSKTCHKAQNASLQGLKQVAMEMQWNMHSISY
jgi:hypothetical protein